MRPSPLALVFSLVFAVLSATLCAPTAAQSRPATPAYQIIVHPSNPTTSVDRQFLEDVFLKKITTWPGGGTIRPVDLPPNSPIRRKFTEDILSRTVEAVKGYWQQRIFSGRDVPPPELDTDDDVVKYVLKYDGAVGYVSGSATLEGPRVLAVR